MCGMKTCARCGAPIDRSACNQNIVTFTQIEDDGMHTKRTRGYLCDSCFNYFELFLLRSKRGLRK